MHMQAASSCYWVTLASHVSIPPLSETVVSVKIEGGHDTAQWGMLEPPSFAENDGHADDILVGRTLVDMQKQTTPLRVMNLSQEPKVIRRGATPACCEPVVSIINPRSSAPLGRITGVSREATLEGLPIHLKSCTISAFCRWSGNHREGGTPPTSLPIFQFLF